jgi:hypothetical protein
VLMFFTGVIILLGRYVDQRRTSSQGRI